MTRCPAFSPHRLALARVRTHGNSTQMTGQPKYITQTLCMPATDTAQTNGTGVPATHTCRKLSYCYKELLLPPQPPTGKSYSLESTWRVYNDFLGKRLWEQQWLGAKTGQHPDSPWLGPKSTMHFALDPTSL